jgi:hypothetical protein
MIVIYSRYTGSSAMDHWSNALDVQMMCHKLGKYRQINGTDEDRKAVQSYVATHLDTARPVMRMSMEREFYAISIDQPEMDILNRHNKTNGMLALPMQSSPEQERVLNKLILHGWLQFVNLNPIIGPDLFRIFAITPFARDWLMTNCPGDSVDTNVIYVLDTLVNKWECVQKISEQ